MIEVNASGPNGLLATVRILNVKTFGDGKYADYTVQIGIDTGAGTVAVYQRTIWSFPRKEYNVLGLVIQALSTLDEKELSLDGDPDAPGRPSNLARELGRAFGAL